MRTVTRAEWKLLRASPQDVRLRQEDLIPGRTVPLGWEFEGRTFVWSPPLQSWEEVAIADREPISIGRWSG